MLPYTTNTWQYVCAILLVIQVAGGTESYCPQVLERDNCVFNKQKERDNLSVLLVSSYFVGHQLPMVALGEELVRRGHKATILTPVTEGSSFATYFNNGVSFLAAGLVNRNDSQKSARMGRNILTYILHEVSNQDKALVQSIKNLRAAVDRLDSRQWDYIVVDSTVPVIMYYIARQWKTTKVMGFMSAQVSPRAAHPPWPSPVFMSSLKEDMTFAERLVNELMLNAMTLCLPWIMPRIYEVEDSLNLNEDYIGDMGVTYPMILTTVLGFEYPRLVLPLMHYVGPLFLKSYPPLDQELLLWLEGKRNKSVVYVSMGTTAELTSGQAKHIYQGIVGSNLNYSIVWVIRDSNRNAVENFHRDPSRAFIVAWLPQFTILQHRTVAMAVLHCGIGGVQEALYHKVPVVCIPYAYDQHETAARLEYWGLGINMKEKGLHARGIRHAMQRVRSGEFDASVRKMSAIFRASGGTRAAADLVELYVEVGHDHGVPAFAKYKWSWVKYYKVDLLAFAIVLVFAVVTCLKRCAFLI